MTLPARSTLILYPIGRPARKRVASLRLPVTGPLDDVAAARGRHEAPVRPGVQHPDPRQRDARAPAREIAKGQRNERDADHAWA